jgi:SAM-dependent methyltransferase/uncharacterized protein YbaR (Trm112 family)
MKERISPDLVALLCCPSTGEQLRVVDDDRLVNASGTHTYPIVFGIPVLFTTTSTPTHSGLNAIMEENAQIIADPSPAIARSEDVFVQNMLVATCGNLFHRSRLAKDFPLAELPFKFPFGRILDIGCNWGRWSMGGALQGYSVVGIDPHLDALIQAKKLARRFCPKNEPAFVCCDARHMPFVKSSFNGVFSYSVLQHFSRENMLTIVSEASRVLAPNGSSCIQMPNRTGIRAVINRIQGKDPADEEFNVRYYSMTELRTAFSSRIGPTNFKVDCFLGLNVHYRDINLVPGWRKAVILFALVLKQLSNVIYPLQQLADSVLVISRRAI